MKKETYMPFFYDWLPVFEELDAEDFKSLVLKMVKYHKNPKRIPKPLGSTKLIEAIIFPQLKRLITCRENGKKGGNPKIKKEQKSEENRLKGGSTLGSSLGSNTNTNTKTKTKTNTDTNTNPNPNTNTSPNPNPITNTNEERFGIFWEKYPRRMNRSNAFFEFIKLNLSDCEFEEMLSSLEKHKHSLQWRDSQYIPLPENYLKNRKWTDELEADNSTFDTDDMFEQALIRSRKIFEEGAKKRLAN